MNPAQRRTATWVTSIQLLLNLNWALYVAFLPALMKAAGLDPRLAIVLVMVDQATFAVADWAAGVYADRLARTVRRIGPTVTGFAVASSAALLVLPWVSRLGVPWLMIGTTLLWAVASAALRAPVFTLLGRYAGAARAPGAISLALTGVGVAGAIAPLVTLALAEADPRLPLGVGAVTLAVAALLASRIERLLPEPAAPAADDAAARTLRRIAAATVAAIALVAAFGTQVYTVSLLAPLRAAGLPWVAWWGPMFWLGFALGTVVSAWLGKSAPRQRGAAALLVGAVAMLVAPEAPGFAWFVPLQLVAGAAWAVFMSAAVRSALDAAGGSGTGAGGPLGMIFSSLALAALARIALAASGWQPGADGYWLPVGAWIVAAAAFAWWRPAPVQTTPRTQST